ncbi:MAG TPA: TIGR04551 family protein, partial [Kofleriaceae bacterium]
LPLGVLKVGRMPDQWGMGILHNAGGADPINGAYNYDADYGDTVDRASFSLLIPGTNLRAMVATDWSSTRLASNQTTANKGQDGHPYDLDDSDDSTSWLGAISRIDSPQDFKDTVARGELALNYGARFEYRTQDWDYDTTDFTLGGATDPGGLPGSNIDSPHYVPRHLKQYSPDVWLKAGYKDVMLEAEFAAQLGSVENLEDFGHTGTVDIRRYGGAGRVTWAGLDNKFHASVESGFASGDSVVDPAHPGVLNLAYVDTAASISDGKLTRFEFNRDYQIDMILWRHLIGAVSNAAYIKPQISYEITHGIAFRGANITSFALRPVATPGHESLLGTEFNAELSYTWNGIYLGIAYGVLFPLGGLNHPADTTTEKYGFTNTADAVNSLANVMDAGTAHTVQSRLVLSF